MNKSCSSQLNENLTGAGRSWFVAHSQLAAHSCQDAGGPEFDTGQNLTAMGDPCLLTPSLVYGTEI